MSHMHTGKADLPVKVLDNQWEKLKLPTGHLIYIAGQIESEIGMPQYKSLSKSSDTSLPAGKVKEGEGFFSSRRIRQLALSHFGCGTEVPKPEGRSIKPSLIPEAWYPILCWPQTSAREKNTSSWPQKLVISNGQGYFAPAENLEVAVAQEIGSSDRLSEDSTSHP